MTDEFFKWLCPRCGRACESTGQKNVCPRCETEVPDLWTPTTHPITTPDTNPDTHTTTGIDRKG